MRWEGRKRSTNVEDRRGRRRPTGWPGRGPVRRLPRGGSGSGVRRAGGSSILLFIIVAIGLWIFAGINPLQLIDMVARQDGGPVLTSPERAPGSPRDVAAENQRAEFLSVVLNETEETWGDIFAANGATYAQPTLVLYSGFTQSGCGFGNAAVGPFYCPADQRVYIDLSFFDTLSRQFGAPGDFAQAYVLAHEVGHHVQNLTGTLGRYHRERQRMGERRANLESVKVELQADCYAGIWAHAADRLGILEEGDIDEALLAASAVGDDVMQRRTQGYVVPESFNHGTARQRSRWFRIGYRSGNPADCDTFSAPSL